jgi:hypothetical protein
MTTKKRKKTSGPSPARVKIKGDWSEAVKKALEKKRPAEGWPDQSKPRGSVKKKVI